MLHTTQIESQDKCTFTVNKDFRGCEGMFKPDTKLVYTFLTLIGERRASINQS